MNINALLIRRWVVTGLSLLLSSCAEDKLEIIYIGQQVIPHKYLYQNTVVGGLSSLDYNPETARYAAISDDRSDFNPARFYELALDYDAKGFHDWQLTDVTMLRRPDGSAFPPPVPVRGKSSVDPEALRYASGEQGYFWTSEGHANYDVAPFLRQMDRDGGYRRDFPIPEKYLPTAKQGIRENAAFEALSLSADKKSILTTTEGPLKQDGAEATADRGAPVRLLQFDLKSGKPIHEYVYNIEPFHKKARQPDRFSVTGVADILAVNDQKFIILERSYMTGFGNSVKLWRVSLDGATDVLTLDSLRGAKYRPVSKNLLLDLADLGIEIDNIEGITFGKKLQDGRRSLLLISDNNFSAAQKTQILLFAVSGF